jgi:3-oxoacyl-[acyl-carrier protein] reductase
MIKDRALEGTVALVTGGSRGIGRAISVALAARGAKVIVNFVSREDAARETIALCQGVGGEAVASPFDVADSAATTAAIDGIVRDHGGLHILVNNAGIAVNGLLMRFKEEDWERVIRVNLTGAFTCTKAAVRYLLKAKERGRIVNVTSVVGEMGNSGQAAYAAAKAGLIGFTRATAKELAGRGVTVNAVAPGFIETDMTAEHLPEAGKQALLTSIPLGRIGAPDDVAHAISFLTGPEAGYITGQVLRVNGGLLM